MTVRGGAVRRALAFAGFAALMAVVLVQAPLHTSNQSTKFLHGYALAGMGHLREDWLAGTTDPFPLFTLLVAATCAVTGPLAFHAWYAALAGVYLVAMEGIADALWKVRRSPLRRVLFLALFLAPHALLLRAPVQALLGMRPDEDLVQGVAGQYLLGPLFQPSLFGVFLPAAIALHLRDRPGAAGACLGLAAAAHPIYLGTALVVAFVMAALRTRAARPRPWLPVVAFAIPALAVGLHVAVALAPASAATLDESLRILTELRIPHHSDPTRFLVGADAARAVVCLAALGLARRTALFPFLAGTLAAGVILTVAQVVTGSRILAAVTPWRLSVLAVPLAWCVLAAATAAAIDGSLRPGPSAARRVALGASLLLLAAMAVGGAGAQWRIWTEPDRSGEADVLAHARAAAAPGQQYLLPALDPVAFHRFRLETGVPAYVTFKSHPQRDVELIEWARRIRVASAAYGDAPEKRRAAWREALADGVTHAVLPAADAARAPPGWDPVHGDARFIVLRAPPADR